MVYAIITRLIDILGAAIGLVLFTVPMAVIAATIKFDSPGPAVFRQKRVCQSGEFFTFFKFRTMRSDVDPYGFSPSNQDDPRLTRIGRFLRKYSLDELPQLINVLEGKMSLVGPRPLLPWQYEQWTDHQKRRLEVKPGLTGWAQVHGRGALTHEDKIELDIWYVDNASVPLDLKLILKTITQAIKGQDILEVQYSRRDIDNSQ